jgi:hypothetical protein
MKQCTGSSSVYKQFGDGINRDIDHAEDTPHGRPFEDHLEDVKAFVKR